MTAPLYYEVHEGDGPYLLLVHGLLSSRAQWRPNLRALQRVSRPVVVELLGHGRSPAPHGPDAYRPDAYSRAFEELREALGAERWLVCGQSLGAALTFRYALSHPERLPSGAPRLDLVAAASLDFEAPDTKRFPALELAWTALAGAETGPAVLNAANEVSVAAFLDGQISFPRISQVNAEVLGRHLAACAGETMEGLADVLAADAWARAEARALAGDPA